jgi:hypothetical protein
MKRGFNYFKKQNSDTLMNAHLALFDGTYREKEVDFQFKVPSIYDLKSEYKLKVDNNIAQSL